MDARAYRRRNFRHRVKLRLQHPWPIYKRGGGVAGVVIHADGTKDDLGKLADVWTKRWGVGR
jgi:hypothetical protein